MLQRLSPEIGMKLVEIPLEIALSKCLLVSGEYGCSKEMAIISSLLSLRSVWAAPRGQLKSLERAKDKFAVCCLTFRLMKSIGHWQSLRSLS